MHVKLWQHKSKEVSIFVINFEREIITDYNFLQLLNLNFADAARLGVFH